MTLQETINAEYKKILGTAVIRHIDQMDRELDFVASITSKYIEKLEIRIEELETAIRHMRLYGNAE